MKRDLFNKVLLGIVAVLLLLNFMVSFLRTPSSAYAAKTVQYKYVRTQWPGNPEKFEAMLNKYGKDGWELVADSEMSGFIFKK
ncbi:MAG: DUF4177 domain-containing protein [Nitrospirae bacterium]|nr:DUF4177 domain-containing protein [Nitrospirota bacterium]